MQAFPNESTVPNADASVVEQFTALAAALFAVPAGAGVPGVLERVVDTAARLVPEADMVSVTVRRSDGGFTTPVENDPLATHLDQLQYDDREGPCVTATATPGPGVAYSPDLAGDPQWPAFGPTAADAGVRCVLSTGMFPGGDPPRLGALNYYAYQPHTLDHTDRDIMLILAAHAATALAYSARLEQAAEREVQLHEALQTRDVIGQAKGILMERRGYDAERAFDVLRRASQDLNIKLRDVAHTLATRRDQM